MPRPRVGDSTSDQDIFESSASAKHKVGQRAFLDDGRVFYYTRAGAADLSPGQLCQAEDMAATALDKAVTATAIGSNVVNVTPGSVSHNANVFGEGYLCVNDDVGEGYTYKIRSHPAMSGGSALDFTLYDNIQVALTTASTVTLTKNPWADVVIAGAAQDHLSVGVPNATITAAQYGWTQTWGVASVWADGTAAQGVNLASGAVAGQTEINGTTDQSIGTTMTAQVDQDYRPVFLNIAA